jgi:hypothetical protein
MKRFSLTLILSVCGLAQGAEPELPPLGQRVYIIDEIKPFNPSVIAPLSKTPSATYLRDPGSPKRVKIEPAKPARSPVAARNMKGGLVETGKLSFKMQPIAGRLSRPRLNFELEFLGSSRADERETVDVLPRIYATGQSLSALEEATPN